MPRPTNANLMPGGPGYREGRRQRQIRRVLVAASGKPVSTVQFMRAIYLRGETWVKWRWLDVRRSAERYAVRVMPRTKPLRWRLKPEFQDKR